VLIHPSRCVSIEKTKAMGSLFVGGSSMLSQSSLSQSGGASQLNTTTTPQVRVSVNSNRLSMKLLKTHSIRISL
jgi:hypothetical protein